MNIKKLLEEKASRLKQIENLQSEIKGLDVAIRVMSGENSNEPQVVLEPKTRSKNVKDTVLSIVTHSESSGVTVNELMNKAQLNGIALERGSVSSLLSRLKREGVLQIKDGRYYTISQHHGGAAPH